MAAALLAPGRAQSPCFEWASEFASSSPGVNGELEAFATYDEGDGPVLFLGGTFRGAGRTKADRIVRWDGVDWSGVGGGVDGPGNVTVESLLVGDLGAGDVLYVGGVFHTAGGVPARNVACWDGARWSALGTGLRGGGQVVKDLAIFDDGSGRKLYATGFFTLAGTQTVSGIARWDGTTWESLGSGLSGPAPVFGEGLAVLDEGAGAALYVGGRFNAAGGVPAASVARWNGQGWAPVGPGLGAAPSLVRDLIVFQNELYAGTRDGVHLWTGSNWSFLGGYGETRALAVHDDGAGERLHAGGEGIARWNGTFWEPLNWGGSIDIGVVRALGSHDDGAGPRLFAGGRLRPDPLDFQNVTAWDGGTWAGLGPVGQGLEPAPPYSSSWGADVCTWQGEQGPELIVAGHFQTPGSSIRNIARWRNGEWAPLTDAEVTGSYIDRCLVFDDGSGPALYVDGRFSVAGIEGFARWDGATWSLPHGGVWHGSDPGSVSALEVLDLGDGPALYVAGDFDRVGSMPVENIARWDGTAWTALGPGISPRCYAMAVFDDGQGPQLYVAGNIYSAGGRTAYRMARWDGAQWSPMPSNVGAGGIVLDLAVFDDGGGEALYAAGAFSSAGDLSVRGIARWDGASWSAVEPLGAPRFRQLAVFDDGTGEALYAGGRTLGGGDLQRFDGVRWTSVTGSQESYITGLGVLDEGPASSLWTGGSFDQLAGQPAGRIAALRPTGAVGCSFGAGASICAGDGRDVACPCGNAGAVGRGCRGKQGTGARLYGVREPERTAVRMFVDGLPAATAGVVLRSRTRSAAAGGFPFGDGLMCIAGTLQRVGAGISRGTLLELPSQQGNGTFYYQLMYRQDDPGFCAPERFNLSNAFEIEFP